MGNICRKTHLLVFVGVILVILQVSSVLGGTAVFISRPPIKMYVGVEYNLSILLNTTGLDPGNNKTILAQWKLLPNLNDPVRNYIIVTNPRLPNEDEDFFSGFVMRDPPYNNVRYPELSDRLVLDTSDGPSPRIGKVGEYTVKIDPAKVGQNTTGKFALGSMTVRNLSNRDYPVVGVFESFSIVWGNEWCNGADIDRNREVKFSDLLILSQNYNGVGCNAGNNWCSGADIDKNGEVKFADLLVLSQNYNRADCNDGPIVNGVAGVQKISTSTASTFASIAEGLGATDKEIKKIYKLAK